MSVNQKSANQKVAMSKKSEIFFYIGLFFFIFSLVLTITLAIKGTFSQNQTLSTTGWVLVGIIIGFGVIGILFLSLSLIFMLKLKKTSSKQVVENTQKQPAAPSVKVVINSPTNPSASATTVRPNVARPQTVQSSQPSGTRMMRTPDGRLVPVSSVNSKANGVPMMRTPDGRLVPTKTATTVRPTTNSRPTVVSK